MKYKQVSRIKEKLSVIGYGCWGISGSSVWNNCNDNDSIKAIHCAIDNGINFFDVAPVYGMGHAEEVLGKALTAGKRENVLIASKCGFFFEDGSHKVKRTLAKECVLKEIDASLKRLNTDYIDIYQLHWPDANTMIEDTMEAMIKIKEAGKIKYIGLTNFPIHLAERAEKCAEISSMQGLYNMLERNSKTYYNNVLEYMTEKEILPYVKQNGMAFFPYSPLFQGLLTGTFARSSNFDKKDIRNNNYKLNGESFEKYYSASVKLKEVADEIGRPLYQIALNWLIGKQEVTSVISGALEEKQILSNIGALDWELSTDILERINDILKDFEFDE